MQDADVLSDTINAKSGDYILVQATKEEIGTKGARLTTNISLAGRYAVYLPTLDFVGVSNKISDPAVRASLSELLAKHKPAKGGLIARTICLEAKKSEIVAEIKQLKKQWNNIIKNFRRDKSVCKIYDDGNIVFRTVRDILSAETTEIVCNDLEECEKLKSKVLEYNPRFVDKIRYYDDQIDMYDKYGILDQVDVLLKKKVKLPSGGSLVFDYTEALTVIDVNTSKFSGVGNREETVYSANLEAATEIARQVRLRNIGGIIIIDFIDMTYDDHKKRVMERLRDEMLFDRTKTRVADMTELGLVEVTRKKTGRELSTILLDKCPHCEGNALTYSYDYLCRRIKSELSRAFADPSVTGVAIRVHKGLAEHMVSSRYFDSVCTNEWATKRIYIVANDVLTKTDFEITTFRDSIFDVPQGAFLLY
jgi:ribonuclease G